MEVCRNHLTDKLYHGHALCIGAGQSRSGQCHTDASNSEGIGEVTQSLNITRPLFDK